MGGFAMIRLKKVLIFSCFLAAAIEPVFTAEPTAHYEIISDTGAGDQTGRRLEALFEVFNRVFMFDPAKGALPLRVRIISDSREYANYIRSALAEAAPGALYLHYAQSGKRELVINRNETNTANSLPWQAFVQYLRAFVEQPPMWIQKGFASFFSALSFAEDGKPIYEENLGWLQTVKNMNNRPPLQDIFLAESGGPEFTSLACSLVSFFMNGGNEEYTRSFTDSLMTLSNENTQAQNSSAMMRRLLLGHGTEKMTRDYEQYVYSRKSFAQLIAEGQSAYSSGDMTGAELLFRAAMEIKSGNYIPYYYLGLLAYGADKFGLAQEFYLESVNKGADAAIAYYALGLNAASAGKPKDAMEYLRRAAQEAPARYGEKTGKLIALLAKTN
jgi:tetratricopeptide (TPR) repeat protein